MKKTNRFEASSNSTSAYLAYAMRVVGDMVPASEADRDAVVGPQLAAFRSRMTAELVEDLERLRLLGAVEGHDYAAMAGWNRVDVTDDDRLVAAAVLDRFRSDPARLAAMRRQIMGLIDFERDFVWRMLDEIDPQPEPSRAAQWWNGVKALLVVAVLAGLLYALLRLAWV